MVFMKVGAIFYVVKGISLEWNAASNNRENRNECLSYENKVILQWKYWLVSLKLALGRWGYVRNTNFRNFFYMNLHTEPSILRHALNYR